MSALNLPMTVPIEAESLDRVRAAVRGDRAAMAALLRDCLPRVRNLVRFLVRGDRETEDITQEVLVVVLRGLPSYRGDGALGKWIDRTVARATFAELRRRRAERALVSVTDDPPALAGASATQPDEYLLRRWAARVLDELPYDQRHTVVLHHLLELSVPEIAAELDLPAETVRSRLRLARAKLRGRGVSLGAGEDDHGELP